MIAARPLPRVSTLRLASCLAALSLRGGHAFSVVRHPSGSFSSNCRTIALRSTSSDIMTLSSASEAISSSSTILGGDFAGLSATFSPTDGKLIDIPTYLVPDSLLEWGQEPKCLEVIVSEDTLNDSVGELSVSRSTITVYPAAGCAVDNMETDKTTQVVDLKSSFYNANEEVVGLQYVTKGGNERIETIFGMEGGVRIRVLIDLKRSDKDGSSSIEVQSPLTLVKERQTSNDSTGGTLADGGGLDGRTVAKLLGEDLRKGPSFAEETVEQVLCQTNRDDELQSIALPGGIGISYGANSDQKWKLDIEMKGKESHLLVSRILLSNGERDEGGLQFHTRISRKVD